MATVTGEERTVADRREMFQQDNGRFAGLAAFDAVTTLLLEILLEIRELKEATAHRDSNDA